MIAGGNKISGVTSPIQYYNTRARAAKPEQPRSEVARYDSITLSEGRPSGFAARLTSRLTQEVRASATPGRLSVLSEQVASGQYKPDAMSIAKRMLLLAEEG